jgi:hypothetical protein
MSEAEFEAIARMLIAETGGRGDRAELAAIAQVAVNRARVDGISVVEVLTPPGRWSRGVWNSSDRWASDFRNAHKWTGYDRATEIATAVLDGSEPNRIGPRVQFVHARNFNGCAGDGDCPNPKYPRCVDTPSGGRCSPSWVASNPVHIGRATFSVIS